jgi:enterochelin esterase-like enzyme
MKVFLLAFLWSTALLLTRPGDVHVQSDGMPLGQVLEGLRFPSPILGRDVKYAVYLPPDYSISSRRYPVVYLLHGYTDDESGWIQFGEVNMAADRAIAAREIPSMIIVMPDGGVSGLSMGGWGPLLQAMRHPDLFAACACLQRGPLDR